MKSFRLRILLTTLCLFAGWALSASAQEIRTSRTPRKKRGQQNQSQQTQAQALTQALLQSESQPQDQPKSKAPARETVTDMTARFTQEELRPYVKIIGGDWLTSALDGTPGHYRMNVKIPRDTEYIVAIFDNKINRTGPDGRCAVVLLDGVNPLDPSEKVYVGDLDNADVSGMKKVVFTADTFDAHDDAGRPFAMTIVDQKQEFEYGPVKPFVTPPAGRSRQLGRVDVVIFLYSPLPTDRPEFQKPLARFTINLELDE